MIATPQKSPRPCRVALLVIVICFCLRASLANVGELLDRAAKYQNLGQHRDAVNALEEAVDLAEKTGGATLVRAKARLGAALTMTRQFERAETLLRESLESARGGGFQSEIAPIQNDLGNLLATQEKLPEALAALEASAAAARESGDKSTQARALCNAAAVALRAGDKNKAGQFNSEALAQIARLDPSHQTPFLLLTAAETDRQLEGKLLRAQQSAQRALEISEANKDSRTASYALGLLGQLYEADKQMENALSLTRRAMFAAQQAQAPEALYRWEWQAGRLLKAQGENGKAIAAYRGAAQTLQPIRHDVALGYGNAAANRSFRETLAPLFFELADLLLREAAAEKDPAKSQRLLSEARDTVEQLKAVELEDYLQDDCVNVLRAKSASLEQVDARSAVVYLIPLADRTEILVSAASGMQRFSAKANSDTLMALVKELRRNLETRTTYEYLEQSRQLYDLIIRPIRDTLIEKKIDTLVFVPDGGLQTIPFASLHDGKRFLIEEFAVATAPGLSLIEPRPIRRENARVLLSGLSDSVQGFERLEFVPTELKEINAAYRGETMLNNEFVMPALARKLTEEQFSIVHIASHGQFNRDARKTFVLTYDDKLTLNNLEALIRPGQYRGKPVELLVLSACQTAAGDDRAALGLAGVAVKAGARSAVASLWFVNDQSTAAFVSEVYRQLRQSPNLSKARAVQAAQVKMLNDRRYQHPCYWAPYLLIGNWL